MHAINSILCVPQPPISCYDASDQPNSMGSSTSEPQPNSYYDASYQSISKGSPTSQPQPNSCYNAMINPILWVPQPPNNYYDTSNQHNSMASSTTQQLLWCKWSTQFYGFLNQATVAMACWQPTLVNIIIASFTVIGHWLQHSNGGYASWKSGRSQPAQRLTQDTEDTLG